MMLATAPGGGLCLVPRVGHPCQEGSLGPPLPGLELHMEVRARYAASHLLPCKQPACDSAVSTPTFGMGEHFEEFVKLTRGDVKYSEILR